MVTICEKERRTENGSDFGTTNSAQYWANGDRHSVTAHHELRQIDHYARGGRESLGSNRRSCRANRVERARWQVVSHAPLERDPGVTGVEADHDGFRRINRVLQVLDQFRQTVRR